VTRKIFRNFSDAMKTHNTKQTDMNGILDSQITLKLTGSLRERLESMRRKSGIETAEMIRQLVSGAVEYYEIAGRFTFPALVIPMADLPLSGLAETTTGEAAAATRDCLAGLKASNDEKARAGRVGVKRASRKRQREALNPDLEGVLDARDARSLGAPPDKLKK
jgi:hypothetical protein